MNLKQSIAHVCLGDPVLMSGRVPSRQALAKWAEAATMKRTMAFILQATREMREKSPPIMVVNRLRANLGMPALDNMFLFNAPEQHRSEGTLHVVAAKRRPSIETSQYKVQLPRSPRTRC